MVDSVSPSPDFLQQEEYQKFNSEPTRLHCVSQNPSPSQTLVWPFKPLRVIIIVVFKPTGTGKEELPREILLIIYF